MFVLGYLDLPSLLVEVTDRKREVTDRKSFCNFHVLYS